MGDIKRLHPRDAMKEARIYWAAMREAQCKAFMEENNLKPQECEILSKGDDEWIVDKAHRLGAVDLIGRPKWEGYRR